MANPDDAMKTPAALSRIPWLGALSRFGTEEAQEPLPAQKPPRIGLCLSSGGARGLAHIGVIQVLEEEHIPIAAISGSSMGAYIGALWAAGFNGAQLEELANEIKDRRTLFRLMDPTWVPSEGLIHGHKIRKHLERSLGGMNFEDLPIPLLTVATDLDTMGPVVFDKGNVAEAVHASAAVPGVCTPVRINGHRFTDGGASEPLPVTLLRQRCGVDRVLAVSVVPTPMDIQQCRDNDFGPVPKPSRNPLVKIWRAINLMGYGNVLDTFRRSLFAAQIQVTAKEALHADLVLHPFFCEAVWYDFENFDRYIKSGRDVARSALPQIRALLTATPAQPLIKGGYYETAPSFPPMGPLAA